MKAVRVAKRAKYPAGTGFTAHWIREVDEAKTCCGLEIAKLQAVEELDLERLPSSEACLACDRSLNGYKKSSRGGGRSVTLQPSLGYFSPRHGRGSKILR